MQISKYSNTTKNVVILSIENISCVSCTSRIESALLEIDGISSVSVNLVTEQVQVLTDRFINSSALVQAISNAGCITTTYIQHTKVESDVAARRDNEIRTLFREFIVAITLTIPVFILEIGSYLIPSFGTWITHNIGLDNSWLIQFILTSIVIFYPGLRFYKNGIPDLLHLAPYMNLMVAVGILSIYIFSIVSTFLPEYLPSYIIAAYFELVAVIVSLLLFGNYLEIKEKYNTF